MIPENFMRDCEDRFPKWWALQDQALEKILHLAQQSADKRVSWSDSMGIAQEMFGEYGEDTVKSEAMKTLSRGIGKGYWSMKFTYADGTPIPDDEAWTEVRRVLNQPPGTEWAWGKKTLVFWALVPEHQG